MMSEHRAKEPVTAANILGGDINILSGVGCSGCERQVQTSGCGKHPSRQE